MVIALPANSDLTICSHFGHCENFAFFECEDGEIKNQKVIPSPGHRPGFLPNFLADNNAEVVIAGGMGGGAVDIFQERGVEVVLGASGSCQDAVISYLKGELKSTGSICEHHHEEGEHNCQH